jgi:hypothetical protein
MKLRVSYHNWIVSSEGRQCNVQQYICVPPYTKLMYEAVEMKSENRKWIQKS